MSPTFPCLWIEKDDAGVVTRRVETRTIDDLPPGEVLIRVAWSSLNYKDALSAGGHSGITKKFPHVPGIDAAGVVEHSAVGEFRPGDEVVVTGYDLGQNTWGGFAGYIRVPAAWIVPLPPGLTLRESMIQGTAGFTAGLAVDTILHWGVEPALGEAVVTGASGGVGSLAVALLAGRGFRVVAATGKANSAEYLLQLGAARIVGREEVSDSSDRPLLSARWAAAIDTVGGETLATVVRSAQRGGCVAACGLVGGVSVPLSVYPFLLRGVVLAGINSADTLMPRRRRIWSLLAGAWKPACLEAICREVPLSALPARIDEILTGRVMGRVLVNVWG